MNENNTKGKKWNQEQHKQENKMNSTNSYKKWHELINNITNEPVSAYQMSEINGLGYKQNIRMFKELVEVEPKKYELTKVGKAIAIKLL